MDDSTGAIEEPKRTEKSTAGEISTAAANCLNLFHKLLGLEAWARHPDNESIKSAIQDEETRFKVWSGNIGAHKTGRSSLDYRLRDASHLQKQVLRLLADLSELHEDASAIVRGEKAPWDQLDEEPLREDEDDPFSNDLPDTELGQISSDIAEVVNCLLRLSVSIRDPAPHDRFAASAKTDTSHYEPFDIQHVRSKFGDRISDGLAVRLGKAISRRRQYFRYRESHHAKLCHGLEGNVKDGEHESTVASSIPHHLKDPNAPKLQVVDEDTRSDTGMTETSFASSAPGTAKLRLPPLPAEAEKGPFECPFCFMMISATNSISWKRHVFGDLRPYICLSEDCQAPAQEFTRRRDWMQHELQNHWKIYTCLLGCDDKAVFRSRASLKEHLETKHKTDIPTGSALDAMVDFQAQPLCIRDGVTCQLCGDALLSIQSYRRHVGRHQEQLSLFALPELVQAEELGGRSSNSEVSTGTEARGSIATEVQQIVTPLESLDNYLAGIAGDADGVRDFDDSEYPRRISELGVQDHTMDQNKGGDGSAGVSTMVGESAGVNKTVVFRLGEAASPRAEISTDYFRIISRLRPPGTREHGSIIVGDEAETVLDPPKKQDDSGVQEQESWREQDKQEGQKKSQHDTNQADNTSTSDKLEPGRVEKTQSTKPSMSDVPPGDGWTKFGPRDGQP